MNFKINSNPIIVIILLFSFGLWGCGATISNVNETLNQYKQKKDTSIIDDFFNAANPSSKQKINLLKSFAESEEITALGYILKQDKINAEEVNESFSNEFPINSQVEYIKSSKLSEETIKTIINNLDNGLILSAITQGYNSDSIFEELISSEKIKKIPMADSLMLDGAIKSNKPLNSKFENYIIKSLNYELVSKIASKSNSLDNLNLILQSFPNKIELVSIFLNNSSLPIEFCKNLLNSNVNIFNGNSNILDKYLSNSNCRSNLSHCIQGSSISENNKCGSGLSFNYLVCWEPDGGPIANLQRKVNNSWITVDKQSYNLFNDKCLANSESIEFNYTHLSLDDGIYRVYTKFQYGNYRDDFDEFKVVTVRAGT